GRDAGTRRTGLRRPGDDRRPSRAAARNPRPALQPTALLRGDRGGARHSRRDGPLAPPPRRRGGSGTDRGGRFPQRHRTMNAKQLESLLIDQAFGELSEEASALLESY